MALLLLFLHECTFLFRGKGFCVAFANIGEMRSIISRRIPIVALSSTVTSKYKMKCWNVFP